MCSNKKIKKFFIALLVVLQIGIAGIPAYAADSKTTDADKRSSDVTTIDYTDELTTADLNGKRAGVMTGTPQDDMVKSSVENAELLYFNNFTDMALALDSGKIDFFVNNSVSYRMFKETYPDFIYINSVVRSYDMGAIFPQTDKGQALCDEFNAYIAKIDADGTLDELKEYWLNPNDWEACDIPASGENGILQFGTCTSNKPYAMVIDGGYGGFDVAVVAGFCRENGYGMQVSDTDFSGFLSGIASGKLDIAAGQISWTAERAESVLYSDFYCQQEIVPIIKASNFGIDTRVETDGEAQVDTGNTAQPQATKTTGFWESVKNSFYRTMIAEHRYREILKGLLMTIIITLGSFALANVFGIISCDFALSKSRILQAMADIYSRLMQGLPAVVILMILYYIIFRKAHVSGAFVAIVGFGLIGGAYLAQLFEGGVRGVDAGQWEAGMALGLDGKKTFFGIILPQVVRSILPGYFSQLISIMKGTAIVGYIAVTDLTKAGDIIRGATFEAFFPLMIVAIIYFAIAGILLSILKLWQKSLEPKRATGTQEGGLK